MSSRILIVDDDVAMRLRLRDILQRQPACVLEEACDGESALAAVRRAVPDLILLDLMMPGRSGLDVCTALRAEAATREVPIIVLSAADADEAMIAALEAGADDFLRKPVAVAELQAKVRTITRLNRFRNLTKERDRFRWVLDRSREPMIVADERGTVAYANERAKEVFGLSGQAGEDIAAAIGRHFRCEPADALAAWRELRWPFQRPFAIFQPETPQVAARWFDVELQGMEHGGETLLKFTNRSGWVRRELETSTFQHLISHKIRTPLNGLAPIISYIDAIQGEKTDAEIRGLLQLARESADRLEDTLTGVLRYHAAVFAPQPATPEIVRAPLVQVLANAAESAGLEGRVLFHGRPGDIAHPEMIEVVLTELFDNYVKFSRATTEGVRVNCSHTGEGCDLQISAPGPDLPRDVVAELGRPYWQLERAFTGEVPGMGLGLATIRQLLRWRGGDLRFTTGTGGGLECRVCLPAGFLL